jgi:katanin p60 ATPase-containing subunit A1
VIGLDHVKSMLRETVVYPMKYPNIFHGILAPWKAILLYGPPGTGKNSELILNK